MAALRSRLPANRPRRSHHGISRYCHDATRGCAGPGRLARVRRPYSWRPWNSRLDAQGSANRWHSRALLSILDSVHTPRIPMAANLNEPPQPQSLDALRQAVREHGEWPEYRAVTRLLRAVE